MNGFEKALAISGITKTEALEILGGRSYPYISERLEYPGNFRLSDLRLLYKAMPEDGRTLLVQSTSSFLCDKT